MKVGSLCTGYGGLDLAVDGVLGTTLEWVCEFDTHASKVCDARFPDVPNLHDLTAVDWSTVPPVDVLTAGYPCQPFSHAGRRQGANDVRHLWPFIAGALDVLRPRLVVLENVAGHLSLGFDRVLGDLAELGFDAEWCVVRASDVGACHRRARLFIVATEPERWRRPGGRPSQPATTGRGNEGRQRRAAGAGADLADPHDGTAHSERSRTEPGRRDPQLAHAGSTGPRRDVAARGDVAARPDAHGQRRPGRTQQDLRANQPGLTASRRDDAGGLDLAARWGDYGPSIERHERAVGRVAPDPTDDRGRLSPRFVEWMMMLPDGWVTDVPDLSRTQQLKILGNGVVPPQAAAAIDGLTRRMLEWEAAA